MNEIPPDVLRKLLEATTEPLLVVRVDSPDWPVILSNPAFDALTDAVTIAGRAFPDVVEPMIGREMTREASAALRTLKSATLPVDVGSREYLLTLIPMTSGPNEETAIFGVYLTTAGRQIPAGAGRDLHRALAGATRRVRDLSDEDPVTGLLNDRAFRDVLAHDWAVAAREDGILSLMAFSIDDFDAYRGVFGRHGADSCLKRVSRIIGRHLKRASDVAGRIEGAEGGHIVVLAHGSGEEGLAEFGERIAAIVRGLGLHHPRSRGVKFVSVSYRISVCHPRAQKSPPNAILGKLLMRR